MRIYDHVFPNGSTSTESSALQVPRTTASLINYRRDRLNKNCLPKAASHYPTAFRSSLSIKGCSIVYAQRLILVESADVTALGRVHVHVHVYSNISTYVDVGD